MPWPNYDTADLHKSPVDPYSSTVAAHTSHFPSPLGWSDDPLDSTRIVATRARRARDLASHTDNTALRADLGNRYG